MAGIFGLLALSSLVVALIVRLNPDKDYLELKDRMRSWWWIVILVLGSLAFSRNSGILFFAFISYLALKEYLSFIPTRRADRRVFFWVYLAILIQYWWVFIGWYGMFIIFIPVYLFLFIPFRMILTGATAGFLKAIGSIHWGVMTTVFSLSHIAFLLVLPEGKSTDTSGVGLVLFLLCLTELNDVAQYIWGKSLGKRKIVPQVSPNKTWAGVIGGVFTTIVLAAVMAPFLTSFSLFHALLAGLVVGIFGFVGDVTMSAVKRDIGTKDTGTFLPGHGGILDRLDSLTFTAPLFFHMTHFLYF
jgi:phosphatidate cytidylyltransferase